MAEGPRGTMSVSAVRVLIREAVETQDGYEVEASTDAALLGFKRWTYDRLMAAAEEPYLRRAAQKAHVERLETIRRPAWSFGFKALDTPGRWTPLRPTASTVLTRGINLARCATWRAQSIIPPGTRCPEVPAPLLRPPAAAGE